jgi:hypothetical protein
MDILDLKQQARKEYYNTHKDKFAEAMKRYRETHGDKLRSYAKNYYEQNKNDYIQCECGHIIKSILINRHINSKKHTVQLAIIEKIKMQ